LHGSSRIQRRLAEELLKRGEVTVHELYTEYPDARIDVEKEQRLLLEHDRIVLQFPFWWYSGPHLLKKWIDEVLTFGWAYGPGGDRLHGKELGLAISTGSEADAYGPNGYNRFTMAEMTRPYEVTSDIIGTRFMPLFVVHGAMSISDEALERTASMYADFATDSMDDARWVDGRQAPLETK